MENRFFAVLKYITQSRIRISYFSQFFLMLFLMRCAIAPVAYHEDLPAYSPEWGFPEIRFGLHQKYWYRDSEWSSERYGNFGIRVGQRLNILNLEQGLVSYSFTNKIILGLHAGIGLKNSLLMIRGAWFPLNIYSYPYSYPEPVKVEFKVKDAWWQISLLTGTNYRPKGFGWYLGGRASNYAIGPFLGVELGQDIASFRTEASATFKSFWAHQRVKGQVFTIGFSATYHGKSKVE